MGIFLACPRADYIATSKLVPTDIDNLEDSPEFASIPWISFARDSR